MWYLVGVIWIAAMVWIVAAYTRKQRQRTAERALQMEKLVAELKANPRRMDADDTLLKPADSIPSPITAFTRKPRLLPQSAALLYYVFRTGLPDHEIFAGVVLEDVVDVAAPADQREQHLRKIAGLRLDLVVCTKQLEVVAAVIVSATSTAAAATAEREKLATQCLQAAGIRVVRVDPAAPPRHQHVHTLVYG